MAIACVISIVDTLTATLTRILLSYLLEPITRRKVNSGFNRRFIRSPDF
jgi:hypothetical protein